MEELFDNTEISLALRSNFELKRALYLFLLIQKKPFVRIGTALTNFALKSKLPIEKLIRTTVYDHFCGGIDEDDCLEVIRKLYAKNVYTVLDYSSEGKKSEKHFDEAVEKILKILECARFNKAIPFIVFKPTGLGRFDLYRKLTEIGVLHETEQKEWLRIKKRFQRVCSKAHSLGIPVMIDAGESWIQGAADELIEDLMQKYNTKEVIVYTTIQAYRWDRVEYLKYLHQKSMTKGFRFGIKLVRGAYMEKERQRARKRGYQDPICINKKMTDSHYDEILEYTLDHLGQIELFAGTHNEASSYLLIEMMEKKGIAANDKSIWFGQLFGMSDHISFNLANKGYNVAKYLPFGPVREVMPYLFRRAAENTSVEGQSSRELSLIRKEIDRRKLLELM